MNEFILIVLNGYILIVFNFFNISFLTQLYFLSDSTAEILVYIYIYYSATFSISLISLNVFAHISHVESE